MGKIIDLTGQRFGRLIVIKRADNSKDNRAKWLCKCDCGNEVTVCSNSLKGKHTQSCGCIRKEKAEQRFKKHNLSKSRIFKIFMSMKRRCYTKSQSRYKYYGGRGIKVCDEWMNKENGFLNFYEWAMKNGYKDDLSLDRINVNGNYEPNNCRWITIKKQANNRRNNVYITHKEETHTISEWSDITNLPYKLLHARYSRGCTIEEIFYRGKLKNGPKKC